MYCSECGTALPADATACPSCGRNVSSAEALKATSKKLAKEAKDLSKHSWRALAGFATNPVGGLEPAYAGLGEATARAVGLFFGALLVACVVFATLLEPGHSARLFGSWGRGVMVPALKLGIAAAVTFGALAGVATAARKLLGGSGGLESDLFFCGAAVLPAGVFVLLAGILGAGNAEVLMVLWLFALCYTVLILFTGFRALSGLSERAAAAAVPVALLIAGWAAKIVTTVLF